MSWGGVAAGDVLLLAAMLVTLMSGVEYFWKNRGVFAHKE
jgi:hypothetical protein